MVLSSSVEGEVKPYYEHAGITIYHGDARDVLPQLEADLCITDPPYGIGFKYDGDFTDTVSGYAEWLWPTLELAESRLTPIGAMAVFQSAKWASKWSEWFPRPYRLITIPKKFVQMNTALVTWATDYVLYWPMADHPKGHQEWQPEPSRDWFVSTDCCIPRSGHEKGHPCPRPPDMMEYLISIIAPPGCVILDRDRRKVLRDRSEKIEPRSAGVLRMTDLENLQGLRQKFNGSGENIALFEIAIQLAKLNENIEKLRAVVRGMYP